MLMIALNPNWSMKTQILNPLLVIMMVMGTTALVVSGPQGLELQQEQLTSRSSAHEGRNA